MDEKDDDDEDSVGVADDGCNDRDSDGNGDGMCVGMGREHATAADGGDDRDDADDEDCGDPKKDATIASQDSAAAGPPGLDDAIAGTNKAELAQTDSEFAEIGSLVLEIDI